MYAFAPGYQSGTTKNRLILPSEVIVGIGLVILSLSFIPAFIWPLDGGVLAIVGAMCFFAAAIPLIIQKRFFAFEPAVFVLISVTIGATARAGYLLYSDNMERVLVLSDGLTPFEMLPGALAALLGVISLSLGYISTKLRFPLYRFRLLRNDQWSERRVWSLVLSSLILSVGGFVLFAREIDLSISSISDLSKKRFLDVDGLGSDSESKTALGYFRSLASFANIGFLVLVAWVATQQHRWGGIRKGIYFCAMGVVFIAVTLFPIVTSSRTGVIIPALGGLIVFSCLKGKIFWKLVGMIFMVFVFVAIAMVQLRELKDDDGEYDLEFGGAISSVLVEATDKIIGSGNFFPLGRVGVIVHRMPEYLEFQYGTTYLAILTAPIPRVMWPEKPPVSLGPVVRREIWRTPFNIGGYPPGVVGEAFMNFGWLGVVLAPFLIGAGMRVWFNSFRPYLVTNKNVVVLYGATIWWLGQSMIDLNFSLALSNVFSATVTALISFFLLRVSFK